MSVNAGQPTCRQLQLKPPREGDGEQANRQKQEIQSAGALCIRTCLRVNPDRNDGPGLPH